MQKVLRKNLWPLGLPLCQRIFSSLILAMPEVPSIACVVGRVFFMSFSHLTSCQLFVQLCLLLFAHKTIEIDLTPSLPTTTTTTIRNV